MHRDTIELLLDRSETGFLVNSTEKMEKQRVNGGEFNQCSDEVQHVALDIGGTSQFPHFPNSSNCLFKTGFKFVSFDDA